MKLDIASNLSLSALLHILARRFALTSFASWAMTKMLQVLIIELPILIRGVLILSWTHIQIKPVRIGRHVVKDKQGSVEWPFDVLIHLRMRT